MWRTMGAKCDWGSQWMWSSIHLSRIGVQSPCKVVDSNVMKNISLAMMNLFTYYIVHIYEEN